MFNEISCSVELYPFPGKIILSFHEKKTFIVNEVSIVLAKSFLRDFVLPRDDQWSHLFPLASCHQRVKWNPVDSSKASRDSHANVFNHTKDVSHSKASEELKLFCRILCQLVKFPDVISKRDENFAWVREFLKTQRFSEQCGQLLKNITAIIESEGFKNCSLR